MIKKKNNPQNPFPSFPKHLISEYKSVQSSWGKEADGNVDGNPCGCEREGKEAEKAAVGKKTGMAKGLWTKDNLGGILDTKNYSPYLQRCSSRRKYGEM